MKIVFLDDTEMTCSEIEYFGGILIIDGYRTVRADEVYKIVN